MSRPDSPLRNNLNDEETIKKLKLMLIKEKRTSKENLKLINDLNTNIDSKSNENDLLIKQIQRLSETIGSLQDTESANFNEIQSLKTDLLELNTKLENLELVLTEKDEEITKLNSHLELIYDNLDITKDIKEKNVLGDIISLLKNKLATLKENLLVSDENNKLQEEISNLNKFNEMKINDLQKQNDKLLSEIETFKGNICRDINLILIENQLNRKITLLNNYELDKFSDKILSIFNSLISEFNSQIESKNILQDGFDKILFKCNKLENILANENAENLQMEFNLKDEQIKRLEELIEDNRNISRALETERDQLQNDLVDLRQRHEEKEGYLMEEYREARQNLESYKIFNDKESANKGLEIERLQKLLDKCQQEKLINNCQFCWEFELLMKNLKERFGISCEILSYDKLIDIILSEIDNQRNLFTININRLENTERELFEKIDKIQLHMKNIEENNQLTETINIDQSIINKLSNSEINDNCQQSITKLQTMNFNDKKEIDNELGLFTININRLKNTEKELLEKIDKIQLRMKNIEEFALKYKSQLTTVEENEKLEILSENIEKSKLKLLELEILNSNLIKENRNLLELIEKIEELLNIECSSNPVIIIDYVKKYIIDLENMSKQLDEMKTIAANENLNESIQALQSANNNYQAKIESLQVILQDKNNLIESFNIKLLEIDLLDKMKDIFNINDLSDQAIIIDKIENSINQSIILTKTIDKYKAEMEKIKQNFIELISQKQSIINKLSNSEINENYEEKIIELQSMNFSDNIDNELVQSVIIDHVWELLNQSEKMTNKINDNYQQKIIELQSLNFNDKKEIEILKVDIEKKNQLIETLNSDLMKYKESESNLTKTIGNFTEIHSKLAALLNINTESVQSVIIDHVRKLLNQSENLINRINENQLEIENIKTKSNNLTIENQLLLEKLDKIGNNSGHDLMKLEMAEFDKTLVNLNNQLLNKTSQIEDLETVLKSKDQLICVLKDDLNNKENQSTILEERSKKMKQLLVKTKRELSDCKNEMENLKISNNSNNEQIELLINQLEEIKFQLSEELNEKEKLINHHASLLKRMETISKNKDIRLVDLRSQLDSALNTNQILQREFDSYKLKAQSALSTQQRPKPSFSNFMTSESLENRNFEESDKKDLKKVITDLELAVKDLKLELQESDDKNFSLKNELDGLRWENEKWNEKYKLLLKENNELFQKYQHAVQEVQEIDKIQKNSYSNLIERYESEKENVVKSYLNQIESVKLTFENQISVLEIKVREMENDQIKYQEEIWSCREQLKNAENKSLQNNFTPDFQVSSTKYQSWPNSLKIPIEHERQQGEGMETTSELDDNDSPNNQHFSPGSGVITRSYTNALVPLDKLLNPTDDSTNRVTEEQLYSLFSQRQSYKKKIEHLTEILNDSEATVSRLTEQAKILKSEIRRLEQNKDRESKLTDEPTHEYLKNVIMKFLDHETKSDERGQLVPVIVTLLSLNLHEKEKLITFSKIIQFGKKQDTDGWYGYFNWTGIS